MLPDVAETIEGKCQESILWGTWLPLDVPLPSLGAKAELRGPGRSWTVLYSSVMGKKSVACRRGGL